jgi:hypothetical protein
MKKREKRGVGVSLLFRRVIRDFPQEISSTSTVELDRLALLL